MAILNPSVPQVERVSERYGEHRIYCFNYVFNLRRQTKAVKNAKRLSAINKINRENNISLSRAEFNSTQNWVLHAPLPCPGHLAGKLLKVNMIKYILFGGRKYTKIVFQTQRVMHAKLSQIIFKKIKLNLRWSRRGCVCVCRAEGGRRVAL